MNDDNSPEENLNQSQGSSRDSNSAVPPPFGADSTSNNAGESTSSTPPPFGSNPVPNNPNPEIIPPPPMPNFQNQAPSQGTYYSNTQGYNVSGPKNDPYAITALSTGVPAIVLGCCVSFLGIVLGVVATVFGFISLGRIDRSQGHLTGKGLAIAGLTCGIIGIVLGAVLLVLGLALSV